MKNVKLPVVELLEAIRANREVHRKIFVESQEGYRKAVIAELDKRLREARDGKRIQRFTYMTEPSDHTRDYDRVITMLEMCTEENVELGDQEFGQYVMDQWDWKQQFLHANSAYSVTATAALQEEDD